MKILQLCPYALDRPGGVQRHVTDLSAWLTRAGHETRIIAPPRAGHRPQRQGNRIETGRSWMMGAHGTGFEISLTLPQTARKLALESLKWDADLVHIHTPWTPATLWQVHRKLGLPTVTTIHATLPNADKTGVLDRYIRHAARRFLRASDRVIVPSPAPLPMIETLMPGLEPAILAPCVDLTPWRQAQAPKSGPGLSILFMGRLEPRKGLDICLRAWAQIRSVLPQAALTIIGDGPMRAQAAASGARVLGALDDAQARAQMGRADIFVAPAPYGESFGLVLTEAMAAGAVPVAAANPGYAHVMRGGEALLVRPGDPGDLAAKIIELGQSQPQRTAWRRWCQTHADRGDVHSVGPQYLNIFQDVVVRS